MTCRMDRYKWHYFLRHRRRSSESVFSKELLRIYKYIHHMTYICVFCIMVLPVSSDFAHSIPEFMDSHTSVPLDPVFLPSKSNITVRQGSKAELPCKIQNMGTKRVAWRRVDKDKFLTIGKMPWSPDEKVRVRHTQHKEDVDEWTLVLHNVKPEHAGLYECQLTASAGYHKLVQLNVVGPPITKPAVSLGGTQYVERGGMIRLSCNATGGSQIAEDIDWFKDGNIIAGANSGYEIIKYRMPELASLVSNLTVYRAAAKHAGTYVCRSSYNKLKDIHVQVLVADSSNVKRDERKHGAEQNNPSRQGSQGTISSSESRNGSSRAILRQSVASLLITISIIYWTIRPFH